jgi:hypothetical protein
MARFDILGLQYFTDGGELLGGGKLNFYETGTTTRKNTFSDSAMTIANTNPVTLDADGRAPNIFFSGLAKCVLTDADGVIIETKDPVGTTEQQATAFPDWDASVTYPFNYAVTGSDGYIYTSLINSNLGNDPVSSPAEWQLLAETIGFPDTPDGGVYVVDLSAAQKIAAVPKNTVRGYVPLSRSVASNIAAVDFTGINSDYDEYELRIITASPATDGAFLDMRTSSDNGATFYSASDGYKYAAAAGTHAQMRIELSGTGSADNTEPGVSAVIRILNPSNTTAHKTFSWTYMLVDTANAYQTGTGSGGRLSNSAINAVRVYFSTGNIASGIFTLYGVRKT